MTEIENVEITLYLTFRMAGELLAFEVARVREVLDLCAITRVPRTPDYLKGVINLRGSVIPVVDLGLCFGIASSVFSRESRIVIAEIELEGSATEVGILTDSVHDVIGIGDNQVEPPPDTGARWRTEYISGVGRYAGEFILLLDLNRIFADQQRIAAVV